VDVHRGRRFSRSLADELRPTALIEGADAFGEELRVTADVGMIFPRPPTECRLVATVHRHGRKAIADDQWARLTDLSLMVMLTIARMSGLSSAVRA
jgi:hypothetical protein